MGGKEFIRRVKENFLTNKVSDRELPQSRRIERYIEVDDILDVITKETGEKREDILYKRGKIRQMTMELLYRFGGLKGPEIGRLMGLDYSTVSQGRKRFRKSIEKDKEMKMLFERIEEKLSPKNRLLA